VSEFATSPEPESSSPERPRSSDELRADNAELREELAVTVDELARRVDIPNRAKTWRDEKLATAQETAQQWWSRIASHPAGREIARRPGPAVGALAFLLLIGWSVRRGKRRKARQRQ
jgi:hypothetical protein